MLTGTIIDSHAHCGIQDRTTDQSFEAYALHAADAGIDTVAMFPPVMEIYDRYDANFKDTVAWQEKRRQANAYLLTIGSNMLSVIPYFFIWNDFRTDELTPRHKGIKWHRHADEPHYQYDSEQCRRALAEIKKRNMPIVLEEELQNTILFIDSLAPEIRVIIPHLGCLNGGYRAIADLGLWGLPNVYTDTALASAGEITHYINRYGHERVLFGSDFPFGDPGYELRKIRRLKLSATEEEAITSGNIKHLLSDSNCSHPGSC